MRQLFLFCLVLICSVSFGQNTDRWQSQTDFRNEASGGFFWHPRGVGLHFNYGKKVDETKWNHLDFDLLSMRHEKERRVRSASFNTPGSFFFGKLNSTTLLHAAYGRSWDLSQRLYSNTISARFQISAGPTLAFLKPIYLEVYYPTPDNQGGILRSEKYEPDKHTDPSIIFGNSGYLKGISETKVRLGGHVKGSLQLDWSDYNDQVQTVEMGFVLDVFQDQLPMMAIAANKNVFTTLYICLNIGSRW